MVRIDRRSVTAALGLLALAAAGLLHVRYGTWRPGPGGGPALVPMLAYLAILPAAAAMLAVALRGPGTDRAEPVALLPVLATVAWGLAFFWLVRRVGMVTATALMLTLGMVALSPDRRRSLRVVVPVVLACTVAVWFMFTRIAPVLQVRVLLF